jgi:hypothetical protein
MAPVLSVILLASGLALQSTPPTPSAVTPAGAPLPSKGKMNPKGVNSELAGDTKEDGVMSLAKYEGGSVSWKPNKVTTYVNENEVVLVQGKQRFAIPVKAIAEILDGDGVYSHVSTATGTAIQTPAKSGGAQTVVGVIWKDGDKKSGVVLRLDKGDCSNFLSALETVTGLKTANAGAK